jgi:RNA methyltransferase, TrmH family
LHKRSAREKSQRFLLEGSKSLQDALDANAKIEHVIINRSFFQSGQSLPAALDTDQIILVEDPLFKELSATETPVGLLAIVEIEPQQIDKVFESKPPLVLIAQSIQDPGNLGTMIRTTLAAQASGMLVTTGSADIYNPKVVRAAAGSLFSLPIVTGLDILEAISICHKHKLAVYGCEPSGIDSTAYWEVDYTAPVALVLGNEGQGLGAQTLSAVDGIISVPMNPTSESLNVSVCAGIILFAARQQRSLAKSSHSKNLHSKSVT